MEPMTKYDRNLPENRRRGKVSIATVVVAVALTGLILWVGLSWAVGLIAGAVRVILMTLALGAVGMLLLWTIKRSMRRR